MCFSETASFVSAVGLLLAGGYCVRVAIGSSPKYLGVAAVPCAFGAHQAAEGFVWRGLSGPDHSAPIAAQVFLLVGWSWPLLIALAAFLLEESPAIRRFISLWAVAVTCWIWFAYGHFCTGIDPEHMAAVVSDSIRYECGDGGGFSSASRVALRAVYLITMLVPFFAASQRRRFFKLNAVIVASAVVCQAVYDYAFFSVWCFFGAAISGTLVFEFRRLEKLRRVDPVSAL